MFAILVPISLAPLIITLLWAERKAKRLGLVPDSQSATPLTPIDRPGSGFFCSSSKQVRWSKFKTGSGVGARVWRVTEQLDVVGLVLLGAGVSLILLPLTLANGVKEKWKNCKNLHFSLSS